MIRSTNWIGDAVMTTPAMGAVREACRQAEIVVVANPLVSELFSPHPYCDRVITYAKKGEHSGIRGFLRFCTGLRQEGFDLAILFQNAIEAAIMARFAGIPLRAGYRRDGRGFLLTHGIAGDVDTRRMHHTNYYLNMLDRAGIRGGDGELRLASTEEEIEWAKRVLESSVKWAAVNPGAAYGSAKRWFPERFAAVADAIKTDFGHRVVLTGSPSEEQIGREIADAMLTEPLNLIGKTSVRQLMAVLSLCRLMVTNDSGPMHIAAALGVPIVGLFGSTDHTTTSPLASSCRIVRKPLDCAPCFKRVCPTDHRCMDEIRVEDVLGQVRELFLLTG